MNLPHEKCAKYYDYIFENRFGIAYRLLTAQNINEIERLVAGPSKILDFGAATGRISIPLAEKKHEVTAVDQSQALLDVLIKKAKEKDLDIPVYCNIDEIQKYDFDLALAIFTVLAYNLENEKLEKIFKQIFDSLKPGGLFVFDLESRAGYDNICRNNNGNVSDSGNDLVKVNFKDNEPNLCEYHSKTNIPLPNGEIEKCEENFTIRFWTENEISKIYKALGFTLVKTFNYMQATYYILKKG